MSKKKITIKTNEVLEAFGVLNDAKYSKLSDEDKVRLWKIVRSLKPVATKFKEDIKDASEKFQQEFTDFQSRLNNARAYESAKKQGKEELQMTEAEYLDFKKDFAKFDKLVSDAVKEYSEVDVEVEFETISEDAFGKLMASNDWTVEQVTKVDFII